MSLFANKIAIVTGAAQGVGRAVAQVFASEGAKVVLVDRRAEFLTDVFEEIGGPEGGALCVEADLECYAGAQKMVSEALAAFGQIDISVHNVGGAIKAKPFWEYSESELEAEIARSLWPTIWSCRAVIPPMLARKSGAIVNIGSAASGWMWRVPYSAAKGGVHAMTKCLGRELAEAGVRINCVAPGALAVTDRVAPRNPDALSPAEEEWRKAAIDQSIDDTPMGRPGSVQEVADAVRFFASDAANYVTGQTLYVAGGSSG
jgi:dihydroxycyclohexadiene carboxylate dehydrogenase